MVENINLDHEIALVEVPFRELASRAAAYGDRAELVEYYKARANLASDLKVAELEAGDMLNKPSVQKILGEIITKSSCYKKPAAGYGHNNKGWDYHRIESFERFTELQIWSDQDDSNYYPTTAGKTVEETAESVFYQKVSSLLQFNDGEADRALKRRQTLAEVSVRRKARDEINRPMIEAKKAESVLASLADYKAAYPDKTPVIVNEGTIRRLRESPYDKSTVMVHEGLLTRSQLVSQLNQAQYEIAASMLTPIADQTNLLSSPWKKSFDAVSKSILGDLTNKFYGKLANLTVTSADVTQDWIDNVLAPTGVRPLPPAKTIRRLVWTIEQKPTGKSSYICSTESVVYIKEPQSDKPVVAARFFRNTASTNQRGAEITKMAAKQVADVVAAAALQSPAFSAGLPTLGRKR